MSRNLESGVDLAWAQPVVRVSTEVGQEADIGSVGPQLMSRAPNNQLLLSAHLLLNLRHSAHASTCGPHSFASTRRERRQTGESHEGGRDAFFARIAAPVVGNNLCWRCARPAEWRNSWRLQMEHPQLGSTDGLRSAVCRECWRAGCAGHYHD